MAATRPFHPDVRILGAGIIGMTLALLSARQGLRVQLVGSIAAPARPDVRAYAINHAGRDTLSSVGGWPLDPTAATPVSQMRVFGDGSGAIRFRAPMQDELTWIVDVPQIVATLQQQVGQAANIEVLDSCPDAAVGLTVICEGRETTSRAAAGLEVVRKRYGHDALATRVMADHPHRGTAWQWFTGDSILGLLPMGGEHGRELAVVWSQATKHTEFWREQDVHALSDALSSASHHALGRLQVHAPVASWPLIYTRAKRWVAPGVALAGDAAHTVHPLAGQGLNLGLADVAELARICGARPNWCPVGDWRLLRRYARARALPTRLMQDGTDALYLLFDSDLPIAAPLRNWGLSLANRSEWFKRAAMAPARRAS